MQQQHTTALVQPDVQPIGFNTLTQRWFAYEGRTLIGDQYTCPAEAQQAREAFLLSQAEQPALTPQMDAEIAAALLEEALEVIGATEALKLYAPVGPFPGLPIAEGTLDEAYALVLRDNGDQPKIMERVRRALGLASESEAWSIPAPGILIVRGSRPQHRYLVRDLPLEQSATTCDCTQQRLSTTDGEVLTEKPCPDHEQRVGVHGGRCKHLLCRELIRLAQILTFLGQRNAPTTEAMVTLPGIQLGSTLNLTCATNQPHVLVEIQHQVLRVAAGDTLAIQLTTPAGDGCCAIQLSRDALGRLWADLRPQLLQQRDARVQCHIDREQSVLCVAGPGFTLSVPGRIAA